MQEAIQQASERIADFTLDPNRYNQIDPMLLGISCHSSNRIYSNTNELSGLSIQIPSHVKNAKVFIGNNVKFHKTSLKLDKDNTMAYVGNNSNLKNLRMLVNRKSTCIIAGNGVTTTGMNKWVIGLGAMGNEASIVIGDDCMFASEILIRATDGHPIFDLSDNTLAPINLPTNSIVIGPYTWVGYGVSILKNVVIGGASIISLGAVVTKDVPNRHVCKGSPGLSSPLGTKLWARANNEAGRAMMLKYNELYPHHDSV